MPSDPKSVELRAPTDPDLPGINRPQPLGKLPLLRRPVTLYDPHSNRFEVIAANDNGAMLAGPPPPSPGVPPVTVGKLRLGRRVDGDDHFFLVEVMETEVVEAEAQEPWTRFKVRWCAFAGSDPAHTANFAAQKLAINLDARRVRVTQRMAVAPRAAAETSVAEESAEGRRRHKTQRLHPAGSTPTTAPPTPTGQLAPQSRGAAKHNSRRTDGPRARRNTIPPGGKKSAPPQESPVPMGPVTEDLLLKGRLPIPLGSGE